MSIDDDLKLILEEINKTNQRRFTGKMTIALNMNQGGIGQISVNLEQNLKRGK